MTARALPLILLALAGCSPASNLERRGSGSYSLVPPPGVTGPLNGDLTPAVPLVTENLSKPISTHDWWSSLAWPHNGPFSADMYAHPLVLRADSAGLWARYPTDISIDDERYFFEPGNDLHLGLDGLNAPDARLEAYGDWTVTASWSWPAGTMKATFGRGLPFVWVEGTAGTARVVTSPEALIELMGDAARVSLAGRQYAVFAPSGTSWTQSGPVLTAPTGTYSAAVLPDTSRQTLEDFRSHALAVVRDSRVSWSYDEGRSTVTTTFSVDTENLDPGRESSTLMALYRHQWLHAAQPLTGYAYQSPRGILRVLRGNSFTTEVTYGGILPRLPDYCLRAADAPLEGLVREAFEADDAFAGARGQHDTYWSGKAMGRLTELVPLARAAGLSEAASHFSSQIRQTLESWLSAEDTTQFFWYDRTWKTLIGHPASFGSETDLNDHHFHYGYHVQAAALIASQDQSWAASWGPMVETVIKDFANADRADPRFPFLRSFDPYAGHGVANGHTNKIGGYDQESSSESMNAWAALIKWGIETENDQMRDLGIWLYSTERVAIEQYWFDVDQRVFPSDFNHTNVAIVWGRGGQYNTWWSPRPAFVHGINYLPLTGASYYLGRHPDYVLRNDAELQSRYTDGPERWRDLSTMFVALGDPQLARARFDRFKDSYQPEDGESRAHTHHWISVLEELGRVDTTVTADISTYQVFHNGSRRAYAVYNAGSEARPVTFSDGAMIRVPARTQLTVCR